MKGLIKFSLLLMALLPLTADARNIADLFASEPGRIFPLLTRTMRLDMVDYHNSGQTVTLQNNLAGESGLLELDSTYLKLNASGSKVVMRSVNDDIMNVFKLTGFINLFVFE